MLPSRTGPTISQVSPWSRLKLMELIWPGTMTRSVTRVPAQITVPPSGRTWRSRLTTQLAPIFPGIGLPSSSRRTLMLLQVAPPSKLRAMPLEVPIQTVSP